MILGFMEKFPGTKIERRIYGKSELAQELGIGSETFRKYLRNVEFKFQEEGYSKYAKILFPQQIEVLLKHYGWI